MSAALPHPVLISSALGMDRVSIDGVPVEFMHVFYTWLAMLVLAGLGLYVRKRLRLVPGGLQNALEVVIGGLEDFTLANMGEQDGRRFFPLLCSLFLFIMVMNLFGLVPLFEAPTANLNTTAALAACVFVYYNFLGIRRWRARYVHQFMGPIPAIAPFMLLIEVISHLSRPLSLTFRLFGNLYGETMVLVLFFGLLPLVSTLPVYFLFLLAKCLQAFIFYILTLIYIKGAMEGAH
jgi:F-type H+-transporting ATPase subunit a